MLTSESLVFNPIRDLRRNKYYLRIQEAQGHSFQKVTEMTETAAAWTVPSIPYNVGASVFSLLPRASDRLYMKQELQSTAYPVLAELGNQLSCINLSLLIFGVQNS